MATLSYHDSFWIAVAAAAPVVALANTVAIGDAVNFRQGVRNLRAPARSQLLFDGSTAFVVSVANTVPQAAVLLCALGSLSESKNLLSPFWAVSL